MKQVRIGLIGAGTVGQGLIQILEKEGDSIAKRTGVQVVVSRVADRSYQKKPILASYHPTDSIDDVITDSSVDIVVELIGGVDAASKVVISSLQNGKSVVSANKALIAVRSADIFAAIDEGQKRNPNTTIGFEAAVGGALPLVRNMRLIWSAGKIKKMTGILNGTCNYIMTQMQEQGSEYEAALKMAQSLGFAEADPTFDVSGKDAAQKLAILAMLAFDVSVADRDVVTEGIENLHRVDHEIAKKMGRVIRLLAVATRSSDGLLLRVHPAMVPANHLLADVRNELNALYTEDEYSGPSFIVGSGAGALPTAAAVLSDIVAIGTGSMNRWVGDLQPLKSLTKISYRFYFRFRTVDRPGVLAHIAGILAKYSISIASMHQEEGTEPVDVVIVTHRADENDVALAIAEIDKGQMILAKTVIIRMEDNTNASF